MWVCVGENERSAKTLMVHLPLLLLVLLLLIHLLACIG